MKQPNDSRQIAKISGYVALMRVWVAVSIALLCSGAHQLGVRWNTVRWPAVLATSWMVCTPVAPVPITATRLPSKLTGSFGQRAVWQDRPLKLSTPGILGMVGADRSPIAVISQRAEWLLPSSSVISQ